MTSGTSNDGIIAVSSGRLEKRKRKREKKANEALRSELRVIKRVHALEARVRETEARVSETEARVEVAETQRDEMRAELEEMRRTLEETKAMRCGFASLPLDVIATHILRSDFLPEPGDLGRLRAVSRGVRAAVDATGREIKKLSDVEAVDLGNVSLLKDRHSRGVLEHECLLCAAAARSGQLVEMKALRAKNFPWNELTCESAAWGGHLEVLKWARANGCPWDEDTRQIAASKGYVES